MTRRTIRIVLLLTLMLHRWEASAQESRPYKGMSLADALQALQAQGLRIVFSSAVVPSDLHVSSEPHGSTLREQLDELLARHGLEVREGPGGVLQVVRAVSALKPSPPATDSSIHGQVVDALTAAPLARVLVRVDRHPIEGRTDEAGRFLLKRVPTGTQVVTASATGYLPVRRPVTVDARRHVNVTLRLSPEARRYTEYVSVIDSAPYRRDRRVAAEARLDRNDFTPFHGSLAEDPLRVVQSLPGVAAVDDFRADFAVRGSPFRQVDVVIDGVSTQLLQHRMHGRTSGSLSMMTGQLIESVTLRTGGYPRRHGDRLGPELDLTLREGSRSDFSMRGTIGGDHAVLLAEGPIGGDVGPARSARGSWLAGVRQSYLEWPPEPADVSRSAFGFSDAVVKVVFDVRPTQQLAWTALGGISSLDAEDDLAANELAYGTNRASMFNVSWRSTFGPALVVRQRASVVTQRFRNHDQRDEAGDRGANSTLAYRAELLRPLVGGVLESGVQVERLTTSQASNLPLTPVSGSAWVRSGFAHFVWAAAPSLSLSPGLRVSSSTMVHNPAVSRWLLGEWTFHRNWSVIGSAGLSHQFPELWQVFGGAGSGDLRPERAAHVELGIEKRLPSAIHWQATVFHRRESDGLRPLDTHPRRVGDVLVGPSGGRYSNALAGTSRGIELLARRSSNLGLSGWVAYSYGRTQQTDAARGERYWADFDQRHTFNLVTVYRFSDSSSMGATFRAGSNFPMSGYFRERSGRLFVSSERNQVRLPPYARLDLRADRRFRYFGRRLTLFVEALNVLNRRNMGQAYGSVDPSTGDATGFTQPLLQRRVSAGALIDF